MMMNWLCSTKRSSTRMKRLMFDSSSGASISSSTQNGLGRTMYMAKSKATAAIVRSPPLKSEMLCSCFFLVQIKLHHDVIVAFRFDVKSADGSKPEAAAAETTKTRTDKKRK